MISVNTNRRNEVSNISFTLENGWTVSIGVSASHCCTPRTPQGFNPEREDVEVAVILPNGRWGTREVVKEVLGYDHDDDVAPHLNADEVARIIAHVQLQG